MSNRLARVALVTLLLTSVIAPAPAAAQQPDPARSKGRAFTSESAMRRRAKNSVMPAYPEAALRGGVQGLAVALVTFDEEGEVIRVEILKAPDESIAAAVRDALKLWKFTPPNHPSTMGMPTQGTLRFSFTIEEGRGRVQYGSVERPLLSEVGHEDAGRDSAPAARRHRHGLREAAARISRESDPR